MNVQLLGFAWTANDYEGPKMSMIFSSPTVLMKHICVGTALEMHIFETKFELLVVG